MWITALLLGFAGSMHCAGMCSPLIVAATAKSPFLFNKITYNSARVLVYGIMGAFAGAFGNLFQINRYQSILSISVGVILVLVGLGFIQNIRIPIITPMMNRCIQLLKRTFGLILSFKGNGSAFFLGALNGLLPCGLTYVALTYCFILPSARSGFLFMLLFGFGTWPVMIGFTRLANMLMSYFRLSYYRISVIMLLLTGLLLIGRVFISHQSSELLATPSTQRSASICK